MSIPWLLQATVRPARNGVYKSSASGEINFNADLARPILDGISMQWEILFGSTIINRLKCVSLTTRCEMYSSTTAAGHPVCVWPCLFAYKNRVN